MADGFSIGGQDLYNILKSAKDTYSSTTFLKSGSVHFPGEKVYEDVFERHNFRTNDEKDASELSFAPSMIKKRMIINYKNNLYYKKNKESDHFYNKFNKPSINPTDQARDNYTPGIQEIVQKMNQFQVGENKIGTTKISYGDFLFCKKLNGYPNNRMVILRRFADPVDDDLFESTTTNTSQEPISVMVTWFDDFPVQIDYGETWSEIEAGVFATIASTAQSLLAPGKALWNSISKTFTGIGSTDVLSKVTSGLAMGKAEDGQNISNPWALSIWYDFLEEQFEENDVFFAGKNILPQANPNLIRQARYRAPMSLKSSIKMNLTFQYVLRSVNNIDPHVAMHNIIANGIRMGTSTSTTVYPSSISGTKLGGAVEDLAQGKIGDAIGKVIDEVSKFINIKFGEATGQGDEVGETTNTNNTSENNFPSKLLSLYRFRLVAALQADTGTPSGVWHATIGNPLNPIISVGDLIVTGIDMKMNNELSYNDFPTEVTFNVKVESARTRGAQELERIFNAGRGRIYAYPTPEDNPDYYLDQNSAKINDIQQETTDKLRSSDAANVIESGAGAVGNRIEVPKKLKPKVPKGFGFL
jgi:hypothetical protein